MDSIIEQEQYEKYDLPFYKKNVAPLLPPKVLDFHTHTWRSEDWNVPPWDSNESGGKYMVSQERYSHEELQCAGKMLFPDRPFEAVCFGFPNPVANLEKTNRYAAQVAEMEQFYPLLITGKDTTPSEEIERMVREDGFFGYKVLICWQGNDYGDVTIEDQIGPNEMEIANRLGLVVLIHIPRDERLADPVIQDGVRKLSKEYPNASIVLAHCGRAYLPAEMKRAISSVRDLPNVYFDTAMVMDPTVLQMTLENIGPERLLFATDLPIARMRGRRVHVADHWVDLVLDMGYAESAYRVITNNMRASFMVYEIILAIAVAADMAGISKEQRAGVFYDNGKRLLEKARLSI